MREAALVAILFLAAACKGPVPKCEPIRPPVKPLEVIQAQTSLRKHFGCDSISYEQHPEACDNRWSLLEGWMSDMARHADAVDRMAGDRPEEAKPARRWWWPW